MGWPSKSGAERISSYPYAHTPAATLAAAGFYTYGAGGDENPGARTGGDVGTVMVDPVVSNLGAGDLWVGCNIADMTIGGHAFVIATGTERLVEGVFGTLIMQNLVGAGNVANWALSCNLGKQPNTGDSGHPGHAPELSGAVVGVPNSTATLQLTAPYALTVTAIGLWAPVAPVSAAGAYTLTVKKNATNNMLAAANFNLETIVAGTTSNPGLTIIAPDKALAAGDTIDMVATSDNLDLVNGNFFVLVTATKA